MIAQVHHIEGQERKINNSNNMFTAMINYLKNFISGVQNLWNTLTNFFGKWGGIRIISGFVGKLEL